MTVYKAIKAEAEAAAELAVALVQGKQPPSSLVGDKVDNGMKQVPSVLLEPVAVTVDNINDTVIKDGLLEGIGSLHRAVRRRLQEGRHPVIP